MTHAFADPRRPRAAVTTAGPGADLATAFGPGAIVEVDGRFDVAAQTLLVDALAVDGGAAGPDVQGVVVGLPAGGLELLVTAPLDSGLRTGQVRPFSIGGQTAFFVDGDPSRPVSAADLAVGQEVRLVGTPGATVTAVRIRRTAVVGVDHLIDVGFGPHPAWLDARRLDRVPAPSAGPGVRPAVVQAAAAVDVRDGPDGHVLGSLPGGRRMVAKRTEGEWTVLYYGRGEGWVRSSDVSVIRTGAPLYRVRWATTAWRATIRHPEEGIGTAPAGQWYAGGAVDDGHLVRLSFAAGPDWLDRRDLERVRRSDSPEPDASPTFATPTSTARSGAARPLHPAALSPIARLRRDLGR